MKNFPSSESDLIVVEMENAAEKKHHFNLLQALPLVNLD